MSSSKKSKSTTFLKRKFNANKFQEIIPGLYIGNYASVSNRLELKQQGITAIVNCAGRTCRSPNIPSIQFLTLNLRDEKNQNLQEAFDRTYTFIDSELEQNNHKVVVHCMAGVSRSSSIVLAYLIRKQKMTAKQGYELIKQKRPCIHPNWGFFEQLIALEAEQLEEGTYQQTEMINMTPTKTRCIVYRLK